MRWLILALLLIASPVQAQTVVWFAGAETGDTKEGNPANLAAACEATTSEGAGAVLPKTGAYFYKITNNGLSNSCGFVATAGVVNTGTVYVRTYFAHDGNCVNDSMILDFSSSSGNAMVVNFKCSNKTLYWANPAFSCNYDGGSAIASGATVLTANTWYLLDVKGVKSTTVGGIELKINGSTEFTSLGTNTGTPNITDILFGPYCTSGSAWPYFYDDMMICTGAYCPSGRTIARQGVAGSPTYTAWVKTGTCSATGIETCWSTTPFGTGAAATSIIASDAQTMNVASFGSTQSGHGTETIDPGIVINACKTAMVAKTASASAASIRRRLNGTDTDTAKTLSTSDVYYDDGIWTTTATILRDATLMEIGAVHGAGVNLDTVEDMWLMCDYGTATVAVPRHKAIQQ